GVESVDRRDDLLGLPVEVRLVEGAPDVAVSRRRRLTRAVTEEAAAGLVGTEAGEVVEHAEGRERDVAADLGGGLGPRARPADRLDLVGVVTGQACLRLEVPRRVPIGDGASAVHEHRAL